MVSRTVSSVSDLYGGTAEIQIHTPGAYAYLGTGNTAHPHTLLPNHNGGFDVDAEALILGAGLYAGYIFLSSQNVHRVMFKRESKVGPLLKIWPYSQKTRVMGK